MNIRHIPKLIAVGASAVFLIHAVAQNSDPSPSPQLEPQKITSPEPPEKVIERARAEVERAEAIAEKARAEAEKLKLQPLAPVKDGHTVSREKGFPFVRIEDDGSEAKNEDERILELLFPVIIVAIVFACPVFLIALILGYRVWKNRQLHKTIQTLVEKGQPIPQELLATSGKAIGSKPPPSNKSDRRKGIIWTCVGGGLTMFFLLSDGPKGLGFIPLAIGIGYLLVAKFAPRGPDEL
ncbi:MAG TPA: DUF6249 domain-containing protein [Chthoniobacterales bacterium]